MAAHSLPFGYSLRSPSPLFVPTLPSSSSPASTADYPIKVEDYIPNSGPFTSFLSVSTSSSSSTPNSPFSMPNATHIQATRSRQNGTSPTPPRRRSPPIFQRESEDGDAEDDRRRKRRRIRPGNHSTSSFMDDNRLFLGSTPPSWMNDIEDASSATQPDIIDLTNDQSPLATHTEREVQAARTLESLRRKGRSQRGRLELGAAASSNLGSRDRPILLDDADEVDDELSRKAEAHQELARQQELAALEASKREGNKRITFNTMNCVICMDLPTDLTMVACGHVFCHVCIMEALKHSENQQHDHLGVRRAKCPVCRKTINRNGPQTLVPLMVMKGKRKDKSRVLDVAQP